MKIVQGDQSGIQEAARVLRGGGLVILPTETVYGLAADATNERAVEKIFASKGRPADNPLIVHVASLEMFEQFFPSVPKLARKLVAAFWPGPLTLVLPMQDWVPMRVTGGRKTVAVRFPNHLVAQAVIQTFGKPVAAPSANRFMQLSPTRIEHIDPELKADLAIHGGPSAFGIESTIVDVSSKIPILLRQGSFDARTIEKVLGVPLQLKSNEKITAPGQYARHYAPKTPLQIVDDLGDRPGLCFRNTNKEDQTNLGTDPATAATNLYAALHELDEENRDAILVEAPPSGPRWDAIRDRLQRAAHEEESSK